MRFAFALVIALAACGGSKKAPKTPANTEAVQPPHDESPAPGGVESSKSTGATGGDADDNDPKTSEDPCQGGE
jgi:hypothetical protein